MASAKKLTSLLSATLLAAAGITAVQAQDACPPSAPSSHGDEFQLRLDMIDALEVTKDDARLSCLVQKDRFLGTYGIVLSRAASHHQDAALVDKLLNLPVLDQKSENYMRMTSGVFSEIAANAYDVDEKVTNMLYGKFKDSHKYKAKALRFIFDTAAMNMPELPNIAMTRMLVEDKAMLDEAAEWNIIRAEAEIKHDRQKLDKLNNFKADILKP